MLTVNDGADRVVPAWQGVRGVNKAYLEDGAVQLLVEDSNEALPSLFEAATSLGVRVTSVQIQEPNLEAVFLHLTGRALRD
jgi:ABC-2 type transport system ATP-binding protein